MLLGEKQNSVVVSFVSFPEDIRAEKTYPLIRTMPCCSTRNRPLIKKRREPFQKKRAENQNFPRCEQKKRKEQCFLSLCEEEKSHLSVFSDSPTEKRAEKKRMFPKDEMRQRVRKGKKISVETFFGRNKISTENREKQGKAFEASDTFFLEQTRQFPTKREWQQKRKNGEDFWERFFVFLKEKEKQNPTQKREV